MTAFPKEGKLINCPSEAFWTIKTGGLDSASRSWPCWPHSGLCGSSHVPSRLRFPSPPPLSPAREPLRSYRQDAFLFLFIYFLIFKFNFIFSYSRFLSVIHFIHIGVYMSIPIAQFIPPPPLPPHRFPPLVSICLFSTSVSQFLLCIPVHLYHFSRFHMYVFNIRYLFFSF